jgi:hypothetical protein
MALVYGLPTVCSSVEPWLHAVDTARCRWHPARAGRDAATAGRLVLGGTGGPGRLQGQPAGVALAVRLGVGPAAQLPVQPEPTGGLLRLLAS